MKNAFLVIGLGAVAVLCVFLFLYDYMPSGLNITKANSYETDPKTAEVLSDSQAIQTTLSEQNSESSDSASSVGQSNVLFTMHDVTKADIAAASRAGILDQGRPDPFAEIVPEEENPDGTGGETGDPSSGNTTVDPSGNTGSSDGTFYNTAKQK